MGKSNEKVLWGLNKNDEDWDWKILSTKPDNFDRVKILASKDGFYKFRVQTIDFSNPPDFIKTINKSSMSEGVPMNLSSYVKQILNESEGEVIDIGDADVSIMDQTHLKMRMKGAKNWSIPLHFNQVNKDTIEELKKKGAVKDNFFVTNESEQKQGEVITEGKVADMEQILNDYINGNISDFKKAIKGMSAPEGFLFMKFVKDNSGQETLDKIAEFVAKASW